MTVITSPEAVHLGGKLPVWLCKEVVPCMLCSWRRMLGGV